MIKTYDDAISEVMEFDAKIREMDRALCRQGGHPDQANWIVDRILYERLVKLQSELHSVNGYLEWARQRKEKDGKTKQGRSV